MLDLLKNHPCDTRQQIQCQQDEFDCLPVTDAFYFLWKGK
jgi:hypothetical protein